MRSVLLAVWCLVSVSAHTSLGDEPVESPTKTVFGDLMKLAGDYSIKDESGNTMTLEAKPVLFWSNPTRNKGQKGCLVVWNREGRPQVVASLFTFVYSSQIRLKHEYHSLSEEALQASYQGRPVWEPQPVIDWKVAKSAPPRDNPRLRLVQMRGIARQFTAYLQDFDSNTSQLELKPTPLYRYSSEAENVTDGAIFSFALGTDPEVLMLIESRVDEDGKPSWHYAFARFHYYRVFVKDRADDVVWEAEQRRELQSVNLGDPVARRWPYASFHVDRAEFTETDE